MCDLPHLTTNCFVNGKPYVLNLSVSKMSLTLTLTNKNTFEKWKCTPSVEYVESMTRKTGNFKTFAVFTDMMRAVFLNASSSLAMKLLTQGELEKINDSTLQATLPDSHSKKRIYFILVYTSEFDRIHYPLPMDYVGLPNPEILQATIHGLENDKHSLLQELEQCKLKSEANRLAEHTTLKRCLTEMAKQCSELGRKCQTVLDEFEKLRLRVDEEANAWKRELLEFKVETDRRIGSVSREVEILVNLVHSLEAANKKANVVSPRRNMVFNQGDVARRLKSRSSDSSVDKSPIRVPIRRDSPKRSVLTGRPHSPASVCSFGSNRDSSSSVGRKIPADPRNSLRAAQKSPRAPQKYPDPTVPDFRCPSFSDNDVNSVRLQIEALQKAVLGLSNNFKTSNS